jgi:hypothetical protein
MHDAESLFDYLDKQVYQIAARWKIYCQLFDSGQDNINLLNSSGSEVFGLLQRLLLDDTILALCRLTDPADSARGDENASIEHLIKLSSNTFSSELKAEVDASLAKLRNCVGPLRAHRHKNIAHSDLPHALEKKELPQIKYDELEVAMRECQTLMGKLGQEGFYRVGGYNPIFKFGTDGSSLLDCLRAMSTNSAC